MGETPVKSNQTIIVKGAEKAEISDVDAIISFDEDGILLMTDLGKICIEGENLKIIELNKEKRLIEIHGSIKGLFYEGKESKRKRSFW